MGAPHPANASVYPHSGAALCIGRVGQRERNFVGDLTLQLCLDRNFQSASLLDPNSASIWAENVPIGKWVELEARQAGWSLRASQTGDGQSALRFEIYVGSEGKCDVVEHAREGADLCGLDAEG